MPRTIWICAALLLLLSPLLTAGPALGADSGGITADDSRDEYVGSGAVILPPSAGAAGRRDADAPGALGNRGLRQASAGNHA